MAMRAAMTSRSALALSMLCESASRPSTFNERTGHGRAPERAARTCLRIHLAVKRHLFGEIRLHATLANDVPQAPKKLAHACLLRGV
jgi:hypothetical protein